MIGKIGAVDLVANTDTLIGTCNENMVVNIRLVNRNSADVLVNIAIGTGVAVATSDYIEYQTKIPALGVLEDTGLALSTGEKIWVRSNTANVTARAHGLPVA